MEDSDKPDSKRFSSGSGYLEDTHCKTTPTNNTQEATCRVCFGNSKEMVNISECTPGSSISIADMISQFIGHKVSQEDSYPQSICLPCLRDTQSGFRIKQTYEKNFSLYCQKEKRVLEADEKMHIVPDSSSSSDENEFECQVKNELVEEEDFEDCRDFEPHCEIEIEANCDSDNAEKGSKDASSTIKCSRCQCTFPELQQLLTHMEQSHVNKTRSNINFKFQVGFRQGSRLIHTLDDNQLYCKNKLLKNGDNTYVCRVKDCKARVYLAKDETLVYAREDQVHHSHKGQDLEIKKIIAMDIVKNKCKTDNSDLKKIFNDVMAEHTQDAAELKISYDSFKRTLQRKRQPVRRLYRLKNLTQAKEIN
ncbi:uncharacterized protein [Drosophila kikkawai]|uniref:Uncharacterized protein n=1 Tax=Drosophila kikkawai TaxID=30033 RepID=A0A6P4IYM5_DROKI|nr:uncharacterized protein LOC108078656 [Drosophila kikkawai]